MKEKHTSEIVDNFLYQLRKRQEYLIDSSDQIHDDFDVPYGDRGLAGTLPWRYEQVVHIINDELDKIEKILKGVKKLNK